MTFVIKHEPERDRVTVPTVYEGNPRVTMSPHVRASKRAARDVREHRENLNAQDSGWSKGMRRGDR